MLNFIWFNIKNLGVNTKYVLHSDLNTANLNKMNFPSLENLQEHSQLDESNKKEIFR